MTNVTSEQKAFQKRLAEIQAYIDENRIDFAHCCTIHACEFPMLEHSIMPDLLEDRRLSDIRRRILQMDVPFSVKLLKLIDLKQMDEVECYKRAGVSRQTWYKILNDGKYRPGKNTVIAFAFALQLSRSEANELLESVGFALSQSDKFDLIIAYFLDNAIYDIQQVDEALFAFDQPLLNA